jgi:hypothetical protein
MRRAPARRPAVAVRDKDGVTSAFDATLAPDGGSLQGTMKEKGRPVPFALHRAKVQPPREAPSYRLLGDALQLKAAFNGDADKTRILLLLNLGSFSSKMELRIVERFVMERIADPNLRVYVVWTAPDVPEVASVLRQGTALATDPRVTHFWSTDHGLSTVFAPLLASGKVGPPTPASCSRRGGSGRRPHRSPTACSRARGSARSRCRAPARNSTATTSRRTCSSYCSRPGRAGRGSAASAGCSAPADRPFAQPAPALGARTGLSPGALGRSRWTAKQFAFASSSSQRWFSAAAVQSSLPKNEQSC